MRIHHVIASVHEKFGGPSYSVTALCNETARLGHDVTLHVYEPATPQPNSNYALASYHRAAFAWKFGFSKNLLQGLRAAARDGDVIHVHGLWILINIVPALAVRGTACALVMSPRGMLEDWAMQQARGRKQLVWNTLQKPAMNAARLLHATADTEAATFRDHGFKQPIAVVPNGVPIPDITDTADFEHSPRHLLFLSRVHPKKGIDRLIAAWTQVQAEFPDWVVDVVGPDEGYQASLETMCRELGTQRLQFHGAVYGADKLRFYKQAQLYILPTHSENFGQGIAEALAYGIPVIAGRGAPWPGLITERCGAWVDNDVASLVGALRQMLAQSPAELREQGSRGRAWMARDYEWSHIAQRLVSAYRFARHEIERPSWVEPAL